MTTFEKALAFTLQWEGGYSNHPNDSGGATNKGITQKTYDSYYVGSGKNVKNITDLEVKDIYKKMYWDQINGDNLTPALAITLFDFAVNSGVNRALTYSAGMKTAKEVIDAREGFLKNIGVGKNAVFLKGWLNRIAALRKYIGAEV